MTFSNCAIMCHEDIDHRVLYHHKVVCHMCRRSLNHFPWMNAVPCDIVVAVNVKFGTWIEWQTNVWVAIFVAKCQGILPLYYYQLLSHSFFIVQCDQVFWKIELKLGISNVKFQPWFTTIWWYRCTKFAIPLKHDTLRKFYWWISTQLLPDITAWIN